MDQFAQTPKIVARRHASFGRIGATAQQQPEAADGANWRWEIGDDRNDDDYEEDIDIDADRWSELGVGGQK